MLPNLTDDIRALMNDYPDTAFNVRRYMLNTVNDYTYELTVTQQLTPTTMAQLTLAGFDLTECGVTTLSVCRKLIDRRFSVIVTEVFMHLKRDVSVYIGWAPDEPLADHMYRLRQNWLYQTITPDQTTAIAPLLTPQATFMAKLVDTFSEAFANTNYTDHDMTALHDYLQLRSENIKWKVST